MLCFNDRTYCNSPDCQNECGRKMTEKVLEQARKAGLPIAYAYFCGEPPPLEVHAHIKQQLAD